MAEDLNDREEPIPALDGPDEEPVTEGMEDPDPLVIDGGLFGARPVIKKRRSRKERHEDLAQPDEFVEAGGTFIDWLIEHGKLVLLALALVLVGLSVSAIQSQMSSKQQSEAASDLFQAKILMPAKTLSGSGNEEDNRSKIEASVKGLEAVSKDFNGTPQARQAQVLAAQALYDIGEYERALVFLDEVAVDQDLIGERAEQLRGFMLLALDRAPEAVTVFSQLRDKTDGGSRAYATMHLAAAHEAAGDMEKARGVYELFETEFPDSDLLSEVQARAGANNAAP